MTENTGNSDERPWRFVAFLNQFLDERKSATEITKEQISRSEGHGFPD